MQNVGKLCEWCKSEITGKNSPLINIVFHSMGSDHCEFMDNVGGSSEVP